MDGQQYPIGGVPKQFLKETNTNGKPGDHRKLAFTASGAET